jgi:hypothetical protein
MKESTESKEEFIEGVVSIPHLQGLSPVGTI